ncbi:MAG: hypothetical protein QOH21_1419, partial [Acidobacteriota bacterium]|nr:hypothetical protein [Acidobacteriota bacterium]
MLVAHHRPATGLFVRTVQSALLVLGLASTAFGGALNPSYNWMTELVQPEAFYGASLANAGDVNGDGYDDVIVSASQYDSGSSGVGLVRVYYGSAAGLPVNQSWVKTGSAAGGEFGQVVAGAGDVNGDGYDDVVISSAGPLVCCYTRSGSVSLFLGSATGLATTAARTYSSGESAFNYFGDRLTGLGDVNGDGYGDFAAASRQYSNGQSSEGAIFVYYGAATPPSSASLIIEGNVASAQLGVVAAAGDVNGDGYADMLVRGASSTRLHYGSAAGLSATPAWQLGAPWITNFNSAWNPMASAGDVNNDGFADVLISDWLNSTNSRVHLFYGSASGLAAAPDYTFNGATGDGFGAGIAGIGDVDGDGYDDVIITAPAASNGQSGEGRAYLYRGSSSGLSTQIAWTGEPNNAGAGLSDVAGADVNHDGLADAILGAYSYANHGAAFVFHGTAATCTAPAAPSALTVSAPADNQLALSWPVVAGAHHSIIYRALAACGNGTMARIGETQSNVGTYVDTTPLPGGLYSYAVTSATAANTCESGPSNCDDETVTGTCSVKPTFAGVASVTESECGYLLSWSPAVSNCPAPRPIRYHVYRGGSSSFTVDSSNRIASCVDGSSYLTPVFGTGYYYVVRAEEGGCTAANEETNSLRLTGPPSLVDYFDDMEDPRTTTKDAYWSASGAIRTNCKVYSGTRAWRFSGAFLCNSYNAFEQNTLTLGGNGSVDPNINGFVIPQPWKATLTFQHYYSTVSGRDGAMLMYASDFPNNWNYVATAPAAGQPYYVSGAPNGTIRSGTVAAWTGTNNFFSQVTVNLDALAGHKVWFRWVWIADGSSSSNWGYYVDQVR